MATHGKKAVKTQLYVDENSDKIVIHSQPITIHRGLTTFVCLEN